MGMRDEVLKHVRRIESCHSSAEVEACINLIIIEAAFQAAERMKEEAAKVCESKELAFNIDVWISSTKKEMTAHTANGLADAIRAIDVNKLFEKGEDDKA